MSDNEIVVKFKAAIGDLLGSLGQASSATKEHTEKMTGSFELLGRGLEGTMKTLGALGAILAGGAMFKEAIKSTVEWTGEVMKLSRVLGMNTLEASGMAVALHHLGVPVEDFAAANNKLTRQMRTNGEAFEKLGVQTRDSNREWRNSSDVMLDAIEKLKGMEAGTNRNVAAQAMFGGRMSDLGPLLRLNKDLLEESTEKAKKYHLVVGPEGAAMTRQYKESMADLELVKKSISIQVGNVLLPILLKLGQFLGEYGPAMADGFGVALKVVIQTFYVLKFVVEVVVQTITGGVMMIVAGWKMVGEVVSRIAHGDIKGATEATRRGFQEIKDEALATAESIAGSYSALKKNTAELWADKPVKSGKALGGDETLGGDDLGKGKEKKEKNPFAEWEKELQMAKAKFAEQFGDLVEYGAEREKAFWNGKVLEAKAGSEEWAKARLKVVEITKKAAADEAAAEEKAAQERLALAKLAAQDQVAEARDSIERKKTLLGQQVALGQITRAQELETLRQFREEELALEMKAFNDEQALLEKGTAKWQEIENKKTQIKRKAITDQGKLDSAAAIEMGKKWQDTAKRVGESLGSIFAQLIKGTMNMRQAMSQILKLALSELLKYAMQVISTKAVEAGAGAASSAAQIPMVGWTMAIPAMTAVMAAVLGLGSSIGSAEAGWDIPAGLNPMTQLHEREMVLPAEHADTIRGLSKGGGTSGATTINIHALDARSFKDAVERNQGGLLDVLKGAARNGRGV